MKLNTFALVTGTVTIPLGGFLATGLWLVSHERELELSTPVLRAFLFLMQPGYVVEALRQEAPKPPSMDRTRDGTQRVVHERATYGGAMSSDVPTMIASASTSPNTTSSVRAKVVDTVRPGSTVRTK